MQSPIFFTFLLFFFASKMGKRLATVFEMVTLSFISFQLILGIKAALFDNDDLGYQTYLGWFWMCAYVGTTALTVEGHLRKATQKEQNLNELKIHQSVATTTYKSQMFVVIIFVI